MVEAEMSGSCSALPVPDASVSCCKGDLIQALAEAAEALRHSGAAMHYSEAPVSQAPGELTSKNPLARHAWSCR